MPSEIVLGDTLPQGNYHSVGGAYFAEEGRVVVSTDNERILHPDDRENTRKAFREAFLPKRRYEDFKLIAIASEEFAHFVQHTRGKIPIIDCPPIYSPTKSIHIEALGVKLSRERRRFLIGTMRQVFKVMDYQGNPPPTLTIIDGQINRLLPN